ncbi:LuxR C-terminal-related transcriptional regulator [Dyadobacter sp. NIV53]|uniref:helix-turn-helix transcriptional regulator n=1 Tax=Dyadobacter sp. NIV53 TaxID=2861765 RepID=UPI001C878ACF|nr:LuxR C-terminal-related transcriptional regulator [Dyadobacter sp. NIV53]
MKKEKPDKPGYAPLTVPTPDFSNHHSFNNLYMLEFLFPGYVISRCGAEPGPQFLSRNSAAFFGFRDEELARKDFNDLKRLIHPDDFEPYQRIRHRVREVIKQTPESEIFQYRFIVQYRFLRRNRYIVLHEESMYYPDETGRINRFTLFREVTSEQRFNHIQLEWYRINELGYQRISSYVPLDQDQELTARETEVIQLIVNGLSSKEIADRLHISINTVKNHRSSLFRKTHSRNMADLVRSASFAY